MKTALRSIMITVVAVLLTVGIANASGVFLYDSAKDEFVINGNLRVANPATFDLFTKSVNSTSDAPFYINSNDKMQFRIGKDTAVGSYKFNVLNKDGKSLLQVDNSGNVRTPDETITSSIQNIGLATISSKGSNVLISNTRGNLSLAPNSGTTTVTGNLVLNGRLIGNGGIFAGGWGRSANLNEGSAFVWDDTNNSPAYLFGHTNGAGAGQDGFYWRNASTILMSLLDGGDLKVTGTVTAKGTVLVHTDTTNTVKAAKDGVVLEDYTKSFGGMFWVRYGNLTSIFGSTQATSLVNKNEVQLTNKTCTVGTPAAIDYGYAVPNPIIPGNATCGCPTNFKGKIVFANQGSGSSGYANFPGYLIQCLQK